MFEQGKLLDFAPGTGESAGAATVDCDESGWIPTTIPGGVHSALLVAGRIEDPFYADIEKNCAWIEEREWWFRFHFTAERAAAGEQLRLIFHGLDTYATIWLDGEPLGQHENMFRPAIFDVTERLRSGGEHTIAIRFDPPLLRIAGKTLSTWGRNVERSAMRKAQFCFGWDWGPRLPTVGIWRPVELQRVRTAVISGVQFATVDLTADHARAVVKVRIEGERLGDSGDLRARIELTPPDGGTPVTSEIDLPGEDALDTTAYLTVEQPALWWTHDLGTPSLYGLRTTILAGDEPVATDERAVGIRTLTLDQSPDTEERGTRFFRFVLNGTPIFARGCNWIPCESFIETIPASRYESLITAARDANMTILRIWGGGLWEHEAFYDTCDRLGIMIWQDFMFACAMYPEDDPVFVTEVGLEAEYQVRRLRSHPALALWCGNNENQWINDMNYWNRPSPPYGELYYHQMLPEVVARLDGHVPYWPGSPFGGDDHNDRRQGNVHNWDVWHGNMPRRFGEEPQTDRSPAGVTWRRYADDMGRFISEFGLHAAPVRETLAQVIPEDQLYHHSPLMDWHNKDNPKDKGDNLMLTVTGVPATLEEYIDFSMIAQAEGLKFGIEHFRRRKPHCSGAIVWQLNDCWPVQSWSVLDYYENGKAGYYYLKRVFSPVLASFREMPGGGAELWITNDTLAPIRETVRVRLGRFDGEEIRSEQIALDIPANSSRPVRTWGADNLASGDDRYLSVCSATETFPANRHFFTAIKDLDRQPATLEMTAKAGSDGELAVTVAAPAGAYGYFVHLATPQAGTVYSDNYFDLEPGGSRTITVRNNHQPIAPTDLTLRSR